MKVISQPEPEIPELNVSPALNPQTLEYVRVRGEDGTGVERDPLLDSLANMVQEADRSAKEIVSIADTARADKTMTKAAAALHLSEAARQRGTRVVARFDNVIARMKSAIQALEKETAAPPPPANPLALSLEAEIRATLRAMKPKERSDAISRAIAEEHLDVVGAVLRGPAMLTGMTDAEREVKRQAYRQRAFPDALARLSRYKKDLAAAERAGLAYTHLVIAAADNALARDASAMRAARIKASEPTQTQHQLPLEG